MCTWKGTGLYMTRTEKKSPAVTKEPDWLNTIIKNIFIFHSIACTYFINQDIELG